MRVLYLEGDPNGARFVSGTLTRMGVAHELARPGGTLPRDLSRFQATILSDFPHHYLRELEALLVHAVGSAGMGLLMVGGWRSFGRGGYAETPLGELLPVFVLAGDDRMNVPSGMLVEPVGLHPICRGINWNRPVVVTGHNRVAARASTTTVLVGRTIERGHEGLRLGSHRAPLLVVKQAQGASGRTAALSTDLAPRWGGGLVDWGSKTLALGEDEEVGDSYATFVMNLVRWVAGEETIRSSLPSWDELAEMPALERPGVRAKPKLEGPRLCRLGPSLLRARLELARLAAPPPQDGVSTNSTT